jgi:excinuclease ABC subunit C
VLIDGGAGQVSAAAAALAELGIEDVEIVGVAKGLGPRRRQGGVPPPRPAPPALPHRDPVLYFVQRLRDEAHRFAIGAHRAKRAKAVGATPARRDPGVGAGAQARAARAFRLGQGGERGPGLRT